MVQWLSWKKVQVFKQKKHTSIIDKLDALDVGAEDIDGNGSTPALHEVIELEDDEEEADNNNFWLEII